MKFSLVVKGHPLDAESEFSRFAGEGDRIEFGGYNEDGNTTSATVEVDDDMAIHRWFCEPGVCIQGRGFPNGTLLHFSQVTNGEGA